MPTLCDYAVFVADMEKGTFPGFFQDRDAAVEQLVDDICGAPWATAEECSQAQGLVARLERLKYLSDDHAEGRVTSQGLSVQAPERSQGRKVRA